MQGAWSPKTCLGFSSSFFDRSGVFFVFGGVCESKCMGGRVSEHGV